MYNIKSENYVPKPQPATTDRIVAVHYYAAWKKGSAGLHDGFNDLHEYPERTPLMGYYDEENPVVADWEIKWAVEHGINCFIHCWYRKKDNMGKPVTVNDLRCGHGLHEALFNSKYQNMVKFAIMFENNERWGTTDHIDIIENLMPFWMENYFKRENYLVIDNKPVLLIYCPERFNAAFSSAEQQKEAFDKCRQYAKKEGFDGMVFGVCDTVCTKEAVDDSVKRGFDFRFGYNSGYEPGYAMPPEEDVIKGQCEILEKHLELSPMHELATASCFWDPTPRTTPKWVEMGYGFFRDYPAWYLSPDNFRRLLKKMKEKTDSLPEGAWGKRIFMIDNWNEWDEGHFVAPSHQFGYRYLQAIREEFTQRDNLPDYRTPQDMGLSNFNKSWEIPDFSDI